MIRRSPRTLSARMSLCTLPRPLADMADQMSRY